MDESHVDMSHDVQNTDYSDVRALKRCTHSDPLFSQTIRGRLHTRNHLYCNIVLSMLTFC